LSIQTETTTNNIFKNQQNSLIKIK